MMAQHIAAGHYSQHAGDVLDLPADFAKVDLCHELHGDGTCKGRCRLHPWTQLGGRAAAKAQNSRVAVIHADSNLSKANGVAA